MINLAIVLVHNKGTVENRAQIDLLKSLIERQTIINSDFDENGLEIGTFESYYYTLIGLPNRVIFLQVFPFGVTPPSNKNVIDSYGVFYGIGDESKTEPRFFNWGLKRATDYGADVVLQIDDMSKFDTTDLLDKLNTLTSPDNLMEFIETAYGKIMTVKLLRIVGQLREDRNLSVALTDYKQRMTARGVM